jgi:DNA-binding response OmpR family regulator
MQRSVLVVDDDESILEFVEEALTDEGYKVFTAVNGSVALEMLKTLTEKFCLVLLDIKMPIMDGYRFLETYCLEFQEPAPIIAFSANAKLDGNAYCIKDFLQKPFDLDHLLNLVEKYSADIA